MPLRVRLSEGAGAVRLPREGRFGQPFCHTCLPAWASSAPASNDFRGQPKADELPRVV